MDEQLSAAFELIEVRGVLSGGVVVQGPWVSRAAPDDPLKLFVVGRGRIRLRAEGLAGPLELAAGDVVVLHDRAWLELRGGDEAAAPREVPPPVGLPPRAELASGDGDVLFGGRIALSAAGEALLRQALPPVVHLRSSDPAAVRLRRSLRLLLEEVESDRIGSAFAIRQYAQLLLLEIVRTYAEQAELPTGWLRLLTDARLRPALDLMHGAPAQRWRLDELARAAMMSRTVFAERFRTQAGIPPLAYLTRWRMLLAQRALRVQDVTVGALAAELGYASESAFTTAFRRTVGESPLRYRSRSRGRTPPAQEDERAERGGGPVPA